MRIIYTIETESFGNRSVTTFDEPNEWIEAFDDEAFSTYKKWSFYACKYETEWDEEVENQDTFDFTGEQYKRRNVSVDIIPDSWRLVYEHKIDYINYSQAEQEDGTYTDEIGDNFDNFEEYVNANKPSQFIL